MACKIFKILKFSRYITDASSKTLSPSTQTRIHARAYYYTNDNRLIDSFKLFFTVYFHFRTSSREKIEKKHTRSHFFIAIRRDEYSRQLLLVIKCVFFYSCTVSVQRYYLITLTLITLRKKIVDRLASNSAAAAARSSYSLLRGWIVCPKWDASLVTF